jgi:predicted acetyltransferase
VGRHRAVREAGHSTVTLALDADGTPAGFAAWRRSEGYHGGAATVTVHDLIGLTAPATAALWRLFGGFASVAATVELRTSGADTARLVLPAVPWRPVRQWPYALRLLGVQSCANLRLAGLLSGPDGDDAHWDALLGGRQFHIRNYF